MTQRVKESHLINLSQSSGQKLKVEVGESVVHGIYLGSKSHHERKKEWIFYLEDESNRDTREDTTHRNNYRLEYYLSLPFIL